jgi:DNA mismatch repair protein MutS
MMLCAVSSAIVEDATETVADAPIRVDETAVARAALASAATPAMRQFFISKEQYPGALLFFRMGDFYELFYDDAVTAARELQLTLTARDKMRAVPMCGVPYHSVEPYIQRLLRRGYSVALCEQMEDPKTAKGVVRREVVRVLTPGTATDPSLAPSERRWLAAVAPLGTRTTNVVGLAIVDLSTGEFQATEFSGPEARLLAADEIERLRPAELLSAAGYGLFGGEQSQTQLQSAEARDAAQVKPRATAGRVETGLDEWVLTADYALPLLRRQFGVQTLDGLGLSGHEAAAVAAGAVIHYLRQTKQGELEHLDTVRFYERASCLQMDAVSARNLELVDPLFSGEGAETTLFHTLDACSTPMGKRLLRASLLRPSNDLAEIEARLEAVGELTANLRARESVRRAMDAVLDMERLLGRVAMDSAGPREVLALAQTLGCLPGLRDAVVGRSAARWQQLASGIDTLEDLHGRILATLVEEPPLSLADGGVIRGGVNAELDELRVLSTSGRQALAAIEERERARTGIGSLKVRFNSVFGYYLEVTKANAHGVPADYERKQTLVNAERFTTPELKELEAKILTAQERAGEIERSLFTELRAGVLATAGRIRTSARHVAEIDLLACFAHRASTHGWVRPVLDGSGRLECVGGRHPVVERRLEESGGGRFIPNVVHLRAADESVLNSSRKHATPVVSGEGAVEVDVAEQTAESKSGGDLRVSAPLTPVDAHSPSIALITGPNMGGKSTYLRMTALLVVMAQMGSFVPADSLRLGLVDRIFTRIGASDNVARGRSTFMVEMTETAAILNTATVQSLVLLDEMGRGTATYDGLSLAWATVEHMHDRIGARTLFATHYHELTLLAERLERLGNLRVTVKEATGGIVFLHTVEPGAASKSYGIEVARLAGLPPKVIERARQVLRLHERAESQQVREAAAAQAPALQMTMFTPLSQRVVDRLREVELDDMTPREALSLLAELKDELQEGGA